MSVSIVRFIREKSTSVGLSGLLRLELEGWLFSLASWIPGMVGFAIRHMILKCLAKTLGGFCWIQPRVTIVHTSKLTVGKFFGVNSGTYINAIGGITMGNHVLIGSNVTISSGRHPIDGPHPPIFARETIPLQIIIEDDVWIGAGAVVMPGITLRRGTVVGANAVVTKDTDEYAVVVGAPARPVRSRNTSKDSQPQHSRQ
jgi:maltose O-acetyltransferase